MKVTERSIWQTRGRWGSWDCSAWRWRKKDSGCVWCDTCRRVWRRKTRCSVVVSSDRMRGNGHKLKWKKFCLSIRKKPFFVLCNESGETPEEISHRPCGAVIYRGTQNLTGHRPGAACSCWAKTQVQDSSWALDLMSSSSPGQPPPFWGLWSLSSSESSTVIVSLFFFSNALSILQHVETYWSLHKKGSALVVGLKSLSICSCISWALKLISFSLQYCSVAPFLHMCLLIETAKRVCINSSVLNITEFSVNN